MINSAPFYYPAQYTFFASSVADQSLQECWNGDEEEDGKEGEGVQFAKAMNAKGENFKVMNHCLWP